MEINAAGVFQHVKADGELMGIVHCIIFVSNH